MVGALMGGGSGRHGGGLGNHGTMQRFGGAFGVAIATAVFTANGHLGTAATFTRRLPAGARG